MLEHSDRAHLSFKLVAQQRNAAPMVVYLASIERPEHPEHSNLRCLCSVVGRRYQGLLGNTFQGSIPVDAELTFQLYPCLTLRETRSKSPWQDMSSFEAVSGKLMYTIIAIR